jgi:hypothetical protein
MMTSSPPPIAEVTPMLKEALYEANGNDHWSPQTAGSSNANQSHRRYQWYHWQRLYWLLPYVSNDHMMIVNVDRD